jgi:hypothetical protein
MDHVARFLPTAQECWASAKHELEAGFLINLRQEVEWGSLTPFDDRIGLEPVAGELQ